MTVTNGGHHSPRPRAQHHPYKSLRPTGSPGVTKPNEGRVFRFSSLHFTLKTPVLRDPPHFPSSCLFFRVWRVQHAAMRSGALSGATRSGVLDAPRRVRARPTRRDAFRRVRAGNALERVLARPNTALPRRGGGRRGGGEHRGWGILKSHSRV